MSQGDTTALLASIRRHTGIPALHPSYNDAAVLLDASEEMLSYLLPLGMGEKQELWAGPVGRVRVPLVNGTAAYRIPARAVGAKVRAARLLDAQGNPYHLNYYGREEVARRVDSGGPPDGLVLEGGTLRLFPTPRNLTGYTLEVDFYVRPGTLVAPSAAALLVDVLMPPTVTTQVYAVTAALPVGFSGLTTLDVVSGTAPFDCKALEVTVDEVEPDVGPGGAWSRFSLLGEFPDLAIGDWLALPGESPVVQAPLEWHPLLALRTAVRELTSMGDMETAGVKAKMLEAQAKAASTLVRPRREDVPRKPANGMDRWRGGWGGYTY